MGDHSACADNRPSSDGDAGQNSSIAADGSAIFNVRFHDHPIRGRLQAAISVGCPRIEIICEHDPVANEDFVADMDAFTDEGVARDFAVSTYGGTGLDFDKSPDLSAVSDAASVKIDEVRLENPDIFTQLYAIGDQSVSPVSMTSA